MRYILKRLLGIIPSFFAVTIIVFTIVQLTPGGVIGAYLGENVWAATEEYIEAIKEHMGLDKPVWMQYFIWVKTFFEGKLGYSFRATGRPVSSMLWSHLANSWGLMLGALLLAYAIAIPLGVLSAVKQYSVFDHICRVFSLLGISMPAFWTALVFIFVFSLRLDLFPTHGMFTLGAKYNSMLELISDRAIHMVLPLVVIAVGSIAFCSRLTRSSMLDVLRQDYIVTARAKGVKEKVVIYKHALRNALLPVVTVIGSSFIRVFAGAVTVETIFAWPGVGRLIVVSASMRDLPVLMAIVVMVSLVVVIINLLTDISYALIDPRIRYE